ncbi:MAG: hypothetical protein QE263_01080 [Vampirovibrionales bacterium]|nr:hypothetical protein [Vampirovibrionales bacterium]
MTRLAVSPSLFPLSLNRFGNNELNANTIDNTVAAIPLTTLPDYVRVSAPIQKAWAATQQAAQQTVVPTANYLQTTWQGGVSSPAQSSTDTLSWLERTQQQLMANLIRNQAMELAFKAELARKAGFLQLAAVLEQQRRATLMQLQQATSTTLLNTLAPNPMVIVQNQWNMTQALAAEIFAKSIEAKQALFKFKPPPRGNNAPVVS